jgi:hypothetical protein
MLTALLAASMSAIAGIDFITTGPYYVYNSITYTKTLNYYPTTLATYSLFALVAAISILLHLSVIKEENISIASAGLFLISATVAMTSWTWIIAGFVHAVTYAVTFGFFVTRKRRFEEEPIMPL